MRTAVDDTPGQGPRVQVRLLDGFEVAADDRPVNLPLAAQRLVAFVALHERPVLRTHVAGALWTDRSDERASACLRSALWRSNQSLPLVEGGRTHLALDRRVTVDALETASIARGLLHGESDGGVDVRQLGGELLPDWYDDWVVVEAEGWRQLRLHALEALAERLTAGGRFGCASASAVAAVRAEPLRESPRAALIRVHLAEGNRSEALREFSGYSDRLKDELGVEPTERLRSLVEELSPERGA